MSIDWPLTIVIAIIAAMFIYVVWVVYRR